MAEKKFLRITEYIFFGIVAIVMLINVVLDNRVYYLYKNNCPVPNFVFVAVFAAAFLLFKLLVGTKKPLSKPAPADRKVLIPIFIASALILVFQIFYAYNIYFTTGWDVKELVSMAERHAYHGIRIRDSHYFSLYPNNVFLTGIFSYILRLFPRKYVSLIIVGTIIVNVSGIFFADSVRMVTKRRAFVYGFFALYVILTGLSPWISIPYSDTYSIFFPIFAIWLYLKKNDKNRLFIWFLITLDCFVGYFIKPTVLLTLMVPVFFEVVHFLANLKSIEEKGKKIVSFVLPMIVAVIATFLLRFAIEKETGFTPDKTRSVTPIHYFMMGLNKESTGGYNQADVNFSFSHTDVKERNSEDFKEAMRRIKEMLPFKIVGFEAQKILNNFNDGTFAWGHEGDFYWEYHEKDNAFAKTARRFVYHNGDKFGVFVAFMQFFWIWTLCLCMFTIIKPKEADFKKNAIMMTMLAIMVFLTVFEARARYLYLYSPVIYLTAAIGLDRLISTKETKDESSNV